MNEFIRPEMADPVLAPPQRREVQERFAPRVDQLLDEVSTGLQKAGAAPARRPLSRARRLLLVGLGG